jgi:drug/metabolite transporter (DMT)-like permease
VAVLLGWLLLKERIDGYMLVGAAIIIGSVVLVNTSKLKGLDSDLASANPGAD